MFWCWWSRRRPPSRRTGNTPLRADNWWWWRHQIGKNLILPFVVLVLRLGDVNFKNKNSNLLFDVHVIELWFYAFANPWPMHQTLDQVQLCICDWLSFFHYNWLKSKITCRGQMLYASRNESQKSGRNNYNKEITLTRIASWMCTFLVQFELFKTDVTLGSGSGWWSNVCDRHAFSPSPQIDAPQSMGCVEGFGGSPGVIRGGSGL